MTSTHARNLTADWLNGWLAGLGITVAVPAAKLHWSDRVVPTAILTHPDTGLVGELTAALLDLDLDTSPIATTHPDVSGEFKRNVPLDTYRQRCTLERHDSSGLLTASVTDQRADLDEQSLDHGAFDPPAPRGETLYTRARKCQQHLVGSDAPEQLVADNLTANPHRIQANGLGFDIRRLAAGVQATGPAARVHADPVVELLCLYALRLFPTRGDGTTVRQRRWQDRPTRPGAFTWPTWNTPLDQWAIDALLDQPDLASNRYETVPYQPSNPSDTTRAYGARPR